MNKKGQRPMGLPVGSASLLMIFIILCLTTFSAISLVSANNDYKLSQKTAENIEAYYAADGRAIETYAELRSILNSSESAEVFVKSAEALGVSTDTSGKTLTLLISEEISDSLFIKAELIADYNEKKLTIKSWKTENTRAPSDEPVYLELFG